MKRLAALTLALLLCLTACGRKSSRADVLGVWTGEADLSANFTQALTDRAGDGALSQYLKVRRYTVTYRLELRPEGDYTLAPDPDSVQAARAAALSAVEEGFMAYCQTELIDKQGLALTVDQLLAQTGMTLRQRAEALCDFTPPSFADAFTTEVHDGADGVGGFLYMNGAGLAAQGVPFHFYQGTLTLPTVPLSGPEDCFSLTVTKGE